MTLFFSAALMSSFLAHFPPMLSSLPVLARETSFADKLFAFLIMSRQCKSAVSIAFHFRRFACMTTGGSKTAQKKFFPSFVANRSSTPGVNLALCAHPYS
jgi:hypothetical protein